MSRPNKDTRAKRASKKALLYCLVMFVLVVFMFVLLIFFGGLGVNINRIDLTWLILFGFAYIFAYFKDYLDEINEKLDRIERKLNYK